VSGAKLLQTFNSQIYMKNNGQVDWAAVRHAYCTSDQKVGDICRQHGISINSLYYRRKTQSWPHRYRISATATKTPKQIHNSKIERLYLLLDRLMKEFEMQPMSAGNDEGVAKTATADRERSARTLSSLIRSFEKIKELEAEEMTNSHETDGDEINEADEKEAEHLRHILLERFAKLTQSGED
jgi:transposase-like protein